MLCLELEIWVSHQLRHPGRALRQDLEGVPILGLAHHAEHASDEVERHVRMEQVAHRVDEDAPRLLPPQRLIETLRQTPHGPVEHAILGEASVLREVTQPTRSEARGVAMVTARGNGLTADDRPPCSVRPPYFCPVTHSGISPVCVPSCRPLPSCLLAPARAAREVRDPARPVVFLGLADNA